jgi:hypothetical protein
VTSHGPPATTPSDAREFWRRYFDGDGAPNHAPALPFGHPDAPVSGVERSISRELPTTVDALRAGTARPPFLVVAASVASAVGVCAKVDDTTVFLPRTGTCRLHCRFDRVRFTSDGVRSFSTSSTPTFDG